MNMKKHTTKTNERIIFTWHVHVKDKSFQITATKEKQFTVDWGDGSTTEVIGTGESETLVHIYPTENEYTVNISGTTADCLLTAIDLEHTNHYAMREQIRLARSNYVICLDVSNCKSLQNLNCAENHIASLNLNANKVLKELNCSKNELTALNVSANTALESLNCSENELSMLDLTTNTALVNLDCYKNKLCVVDLSANTALESLECYFNNLTKLNLNATTRIEFLDCSYNHLAELDLKANKFMCTLYCSGNNLMKLNLKANKFMSTLDCSCNKLKEIDLGKNRSLWYLNCNTNELTTLDLNSNSILQDLVCSRNKLTTLDISANTDLKDLNCEDNCITYQDIYKIIITRRLMPKEIGEQRPLPQKVTVGEVISLIPNKIYGRSTLYRVKKSNLPAPKSDYCIESGTITFHKPGHYIVIMSVSGVSQDYSESDTTKECELYDELVANFMVEK